MFVSPEGAEELRSIRVGDAPEPTGGSAPVRMLAFLPSQDCGCPEELWSIDGILALIHMEEDGSGEVIMYGGDWETQTGVQCDDISELRARMFALVADLPAEDATDNFVVGIDLSDEIPRPEREW